MRRIEIAAEAFLHLAIQEGKKRGNEIAFLKRLTHALSSYELKGKSFLKRHKKGQAAKFLLDSIFPLLEAMTSEVWMRKMVLHSFAEKVFGVYITKIDSRVMDDEDEFSLAPLGGRLIRKAVSSQ